MNIIPQNNQNEIERVERILAFFSILRDSVFSLQSGQMAKLLIQLHYAYCQPKTRKTDTVRLASVKTRRLGAHYVLFDTWFCSPDSLIKIKKLGYDVIAMAKRNKNFKYCHDHQMLSLDEIYKKCRKRRGKSRYILSVTVQVTKGNEHTMAKVVYVRNRKNRKDYLCLISTDTSLSEEEIIATYGIRWPVMQISA